MDAHWLLAKLLKFEPFVVVLLRQQLTGVLSGFNFLGFNQYLDPLVFEQHFGSLVVDPCVMEFLVFEQCFLDHLIQGQSYEPLNHRIVVQDLGVSEGVWCSEFGFSIMDCCGRF